MCSIPGLPTTGAELPILITRVSPKPNYGLVEFWVNLDDGRKHVYEQMRKDIQSPGRKFNGSEGKPEDLCLVRIIDTWHRTRIVSIQNESYNVFLIDQGRLHITRGDALAWGQRDVFLFPPEIEMCILANVVSLENNWPERAARFLNSLPGNKCKGLVQQVLMPDRVILLDIPVVSRHICKRGLAKKISGDEFKTLVLKCLRLPKGEDLEPYPKPRDCNLTSGCMLEECHGYFYPELLTDALDTVVVAEINNPLNIFCKILIFSKALKVLSAQIQQHYEERSDFAGPPPPQTPGVPCAAKSVNGRWHRSLLKQNITSDGAVEVLHVDEGRTELVQAGDIKALDGKFLRMPVVTYRCSLDGLKDTGAVWTADQTNYLKSLLQHRTVVASFNRYDTTRDVYAVTLYADSAVCINSCFMEREGLPYSSNESDSTPSDAFRYSGFNIEVGGREKVSITCSENVHHFCCHLDKNSDLFESVIANVTQFTGQPQHTDHPLGLDSICFSKYTDNKWHRGQVVEKSTKRLVHFVDYGHALVVKDSDICPIPTEASLARSIPVQAVQLGLFNVPEEVPPEVNQWFNRHAIGNSFTISVVAKGEEGKLFVELLDGTLNVNVKIREMVRERITSFVGESKRLHPSSSECANIPNEDGLMQEVVNTLVAMKTAEQNINSGSRVSAGAELKISSQDEFMKYEKTLDEGRKLDVIPEEGRELPETFIDGACSYSEVLDISFPCREGNVKTCTYKTPNISLNKAEEVYASCIVGPQYFWCQYSNTKDLDMVSTLSQEVGQARPDMLFTKTLAPGSPCLALFSDDDQWYRAQVIQIADDIIHVFFIDYGNESDVDIKNVKPLPQCLLSVAPQAFLCSLNGFDECKGSWDENSYDEIYALLIDKPLRVKVLDMKESSKIMAPEYAVQIECENGVVNDAMLKYWKPAAKENLLIEIPAEKSLQSEETEFNKTTLRFSERNGSTCEDDNPNMSKRKKEVLYASCIVGPHFFWCQYDNADVLEKVSRLAQEAGQAQQDSTFPETLDPGSSCLAMFSSDSQWYRALVMSRTDNLFNVVFIDYGNESAVDIEHVRPLPQSLLDIASQAFLCSLNGFDESQGCWDDKVYDDFYNLLVDKPLSLTVINTGSAHNSDVGVPQYSVEIECEGEILNTLMEKYWK
ncbi:tudor domain-containing 6 [Brachionichthys hirsutus]|uniref:tudor domain-containing 6 n=1 Tax=Brachionichthys hirsutus TaxID=412623 RepID=UPI0036047E5C